MRRPALMLAIAVVPFALTAAYEPEGLRLPEAVQSIAIVEGVVYDSIARVPLPGVTVHFVSAENPTARSHSAIADEDGRYIITDIPAGRYLAAFFATPLDTLGLESPAREVSVREGRQRIDLATPSSATLIRAVCGTFDDSTTALIGHVRRTGTGEPVTGADVSVEWSEMILDARGVRNSDRRVMAKTQGPGFFALCGLPGDVTVTARASLAPDSTGFVEIELPPGELRHFTFALGGAQLVERVIAITPDSTAVDTAGLMTATVRYWRGDARLAGVVRNADGRPVAGATVALWGAQRSATTSERGTFLLDSLPGGSHTAEVRLIGYQPVRQVVQLAPGQTASVELELAARVVVLEEVRVRGELVYGRSLAEFERRRRMGPSQYFLGPQEIERRPLTPLTRLLQGLPGIWVVCVGGECVVRMRGAPSLTNARDCEPALWIDGYRDRIREWTFLWSDEIAAVEIYPRGSSVPSEFYDGNRCGAVVVTTRPRPTRVSDPPER